MADESSAEGAQGQAAEGPLEPEGSGKDTGAAAEETDKHGHPGISQGKYERDIRERDDRIKALEAQVAEAAATKERSDELQKKIDELRAEQADKDAEYELRLAGCLDVKAARARLGDFGGDIAKLKEGCPYLFKGKEEARGATGLKPGGAPKITREEIRKVKDPVKRRDMIAANLSLYE